MGYDQHNAGLHFCYFPKDDSCTHKYDDTNRPLCFQTKKEIEEFNKQIENIKKEEDTKANSEPKIKKSRKRRIGMRKRIKYI